MENNSCYSSVAETINEETARCQGTHTLNQEKCELIESVCNMVDEFITGIDCEYIDVLIQEIDKTLIISIVCDEVILERGRTSIFFDIIQMVDSFSFSKSGKSNMKIELNIKGLWGKVCG